MALRGISILDLLATVPGAGLIPSDVSEQLENLAILEHRSTISGEAYIHYGTIRSVAADIGLPALQSWPVEIPGLNQGLPFQLTFTRATATTGSTLEAAPSEWRLDLLIDQVSIVIPDLRPAKPAGGSGVDALHLVPDASRSRVRIYGSGVFRIASTLSSGGVVARFVDEPDTFDPAAPTGTVLSLGFDPPHFFFGDSQFGLTVDRLTYDDAEDYTPPEIEARGHDATWRGISIKQATFYAPPNLPMVGDVSVGVRDVLLGSPFGIQGQVRVEFGQTPLDPSVITYLQLIDGSYKSMGAAIPDAGEGYEIEFLAGTPASAQVRTQLGSGATADWWLPDGKSVKDANDSGQFEARDGSLLVFRTHEQAQDGSDALAEATRTLFKHGASEGGHAPLINIALAGSEEPNCVSLAGPAEKLEGLTLTAEPGTDQELTWQLGEGADANAGSGASYTLPLLLGPDTLALVLTDGQGRTRRVHVEVTTGSDERLVVGCALSAYDETGAVLALHGVESTFDLEDFHVFGFLAAADKPATLSGSTVTVPKGELARVTLQASGDPGGPDSPPSGPGAAQRWIQVEMSFDQVTEWAWGEQRPGDVSAFSVVAVQNWANKFTGAEFVVIGHCCDIGTVQHNTTLAAKRASKGASLLKADGRQVYSRGEQTPFSVAAAEAGQDIAAAEAAQAQVQGLQLKDWSDSQIEVGWLIKQEHPELTGGDSTNRTLPPRPAYRRIDIYAVGGTVAPDAPQEPTDASAQSPMQLRALIPGADDDEPKLPARSEPTLPYRVLLVVGWDSPTAVGWGDAIPTLVELTISWQPTPVALPGAPPGPDSTVTIQHSNPAAPALWTVKTHLAHDARTGQTLISLSVEEQGGGPDDGIGHFENDIAAACLALGPALVAGISAAGIDGATTRLAALVAAGAFLSIWAKDGKVVIHKIEFDDRQDSSSSLVDSRQRLLFDYTVSVGFDFKEGPIELSTGEHPMKVKYKNVGFELDNSKSGLDRFGLVFDEVSFDIVDTGHWQIKGPLGQLLSVVGSRSGSGSSWLEVDLRFAIDLGIVTISGATIRATFDASSGLKVELRGLQVSADVPDVLKGSGGVRLLPGGGVAANVDVQLEPIDIEAMAQIVINMPEVALEMGVIFSVGIPLADSGLGLFGFMGRFVVNGARHLPAGPDPIQQEIDWYHALLVDKYAPQQGAWALGLGAVVGTLPDGAFTFNALGSIAISFPDPSVVLGIDAKFLGKAALPAEDGQGAAPSTSLAILGLIAIDSTAVKLGVRGSYEIKDVLQLKVPINGYFPFPSTPKSAFLRIGADDVNGRTGPPVTLTVLPGTLNVKAWSYVMIEAHELHALGGDTSLNFDGFSVGFGAGFELKYGSAAIGIDLSALILIGIGTKPLMLVGKIKVRGELSLVVVSVSVDGEIDLTLTHQEQYLKGHFCGHIDCFFFSVGGCIDVSFGNEPQLTIPEPENPLLKVDLTDRRAVVTGAASLEHSGAPVPTVWPDTVPVLHFAHYVTTALAAGSAFSPAPAATGPVWSGSTELQYAFRLTGVDILDASGTPLAGPLDCGWWLPTFRPGVSTGTSPAPSAAEGRDLGLLAWNPAPWARNLISGGAGQPGDPAGTLGQLCEPTPEVQRVCMDGEDAIGEGLGLVVMRCREPVGAPFPGYAELHGDGTVPPLGLAAVTARLSQLGSEFVPGQVEQLAAPPSSGAAKSAYRLPQIAHLGQMVLTLPWIGRFSVALVDPELTVAVCLSRKLSEGGPRDSQVPDPTSYSHVLSSEATIGPSGGGYPVVEGRRTESGPWEAWLPHLIETERSQDGECAYLAYDPPAPGPWWGFRIAPFARRPLLVVSACGVPWTAAAAQQGDAEDRATLIDAILSKTDPGTGASTPAQHPILTPGADYAIRVRCEWQGWRRASPGEMPPPPDDAAWEALPDQLYHFHTASEPARLPETPVDLRDETTFDARATARYLTGFVPDGLGPPHFLDDPIEADFTVDHLPQLLSLYGRGLQLKLRRTDQAPGALAGGAHPADESITIRWKALALERMSAADRRMSEAMAAAPCLTSAPLGPSSAVIAAELAPGADYDLLLIASPLATPGSDDVLVARAHFHTSRYRNAHELLIALGLTSPDTYPILPHDAVLDPSAALPTSAQAPSDDTFESTLRDLDLDPWPLPSAPRTVLLWRPDGAGAFELAGVLLETDEPLLRPVELTAVQAAVGSLALTAVRANAAGTRVLLAATPAAAHVDAADPLTVTLNASGAAWVGLCRQAGEPRLLYQETV